MPSNRKWRSGKDPLFRGDASAGVQVPATGADDAIVRHILYLEGPGRETPYLSATEVRDVAARFGQGGAVWQTSVRKAGDQGVCHIGNAELMQLLRGFGKGDAKWLDAYEVSLARRYVEEWSEHLFDFRGVSDPPAVVARIFEKV